MKASQRQQQFLGAVDPSRHFFRLFGYLPNVLFFDCGFYDQSSFTRQFRKHMGITPLQYRKRYR